MPGDEEVAAVDYGSQIDRLGPSEDSVWERYPILPRLLRGVVLLALLVGELFAGRNLFGSLWIGFAAWIATALISLAIA